MSRIGILGGSFDPPHIGHLLIAEKAREQLNLDKIIFIPAHQSPHKPYGSVGTPKHRLHLLKLAIKRNSSFTLSTIELQRNDVSYTVDTIKYFSKKYQRHKLFLIIGSDSLLSFHRWRDYKTVLKLIKLAVYPRKNAKISIALIHKYKATILDGAPWDISSSSIRSRVRQKKTIRYIVPEIVGRYIHRHKMYC